jgi:PKD repeat protein
MIAAAALVAALTSPLVSVAAGAEGDVGHRDQAVSGTGTAVTGGKPESKMWFNDGAWWASMWDATQGDNFIYRHDPETEAWSNTGVAIDNRSGTRADTLWDGNKLYVASHAFTNTPASGSASRLYRYSYDAGTGRYSLDAGYPVSINNYKTETLVLAKSGGRLWATWVQDNKVYVNRTLGDDLTWGTPFALPASDANALHPDDISSLVAFGGNKIGVMWSNQNSSRMNFSVHTDGASDTSWSATEAANSGTLNADDHINLKADSSGRVYAALKTEQTESNAPLVTLAVREPATGTWSRHTFGRKRDHHTRPIVLLDEQRDVVHMLATSEEGGGTIFEKTAPMSSISFPEGQGTPFVRDGASSDMNDATSTKQSVTTLSGLGVMASNESTRYYWHNIQSLGPVPLGADFVATPASGQPPLAVGFTDRSTGGPTSWRWDFGDGTTSTERHPSHTYAEPGAYTVELKVTDAEGRTETKTQTDYITVSTTATTQTLSLSPIDDVYARSLSPGTNYGAAGSLRERPRRSESTIPAARRTLRWCDTVGWPTSKSGVSSRTQTFPACFRRTSTSWSRIGSPSALAT